jgi:crotonobetaine/carnitine-CoA ligase
MNIDYANRVPMQQSIVSQILEGRAREKPDHPFLSADDRIYTYAELNRAANQLAHGLQSLGVSKGDRVAVLMDSSPRYLDVWFAIAKLGAVEVPVNTAYKGDILEHILESSGTSTIVCDVDYRDRLVGVAPRVPSLQRFLVADGDPNGLAHTTSTLEALYEDGDDDLAIPMDITDMACFMFTSGTTGPSKGVMINQHFLWSYGVNYAEIVQMTADDVSYNYLPFFHVAGKFVLMASMLVDARMVLVPRLSVSEFWNDVRACGATLMVAVGGVCHMLYSQPPLPDDANNPLRLIYAVPVPAEFQDEFETRFGIEFVEGYGSTEMNIVACSRPGVSPSGSFGRALEGYEIDIFDEHDRPCPPDVPGEIVVRAKRPYTMMEGYYGLPEKSLEVMRNLWLHSGDQGYRDEDGWFFFLDRLTDSMRRRGENISSFEVERLINQHADVAESAAIAVKSELQEDEVKIVVVLNSGSSLTEEELLQFCVATMPYFMVPRYIEFRSELPRTALTKVRKVVLRQEGVTRSTWDCEANGLRITRDGLRAI